MHELIFLELFMMVVCRRSGARGIGEDRVKDLHVRCRLLSVNSPKFM